MDFDLSWSKFKALVGLWDLDWVEVGFAGLRQTKIFNILHFDTQAPRAEGPELEG